MICKWKLNLPANRYNRPIDPQMHIQPVGYFHSVHTEKYMAPKQPLLGTEGGCIELCQGRNYEQALDDLSGFERIWVLFWFDRNPTWKPKVLTPRGSKRGVFATRAPYRPNPIGLSCVELKRVEGRRVWVGPCDLLDATPILDIKPYLVYSDAFPNCQQGWLEEESPQPSYELKWSPVAWEQALFIEERAGYRFITTVENRLKENPHPFPGHRIRNLSDSEYVLACKTWRVRYKIDLQSIWIEAVASGYDPETLAGIKVSRWDDVPLHREFGHLWKGLSRLS